MGVFSCISYSFMNSRFFMFIKKNRFFTFLFFLILVSLPLYGFIVSWYFCNWESSGVFGDSFGAINAFFTGCAFLIGSYALVIQSREVKGNKNNQDEMNRYQIAKLTKQQENLTKQQEQLDLMIKVNLLSSLVMASTERLRDHVKSSGSSLNDSHKVEIIKINLKINEYMKNLSEELDSINNKKQ